MANYPQELAQDAVCQCHTGHMTGLWFLPARPLRLNTNEWWMTARCKPAVSSLGADQLSVNARNFKWILHTCQGDNNHGNLCDQHTFQDLSQWILMITCVRTYVYMYIHAFTYISTHTYWHTKSLNRLLNAQACVLAAQYPEKTSHLCKWMCELELISARCKIQGALKIHGSMLRKILVTTYHTPILHNLCSGK